MEKNKSNTPPVDPYTGEEKPPAEDADKFIEIVPVDTGDRDDQNYLLEEETSMDALAANEDADAVAQKAARYTEDKDIEADFEERQQRAVSGREALEEELEEYHSSSPELTGGDLDADWQSAGGAGEETVGGTVPTPDQDVVDELGQALGITYDDNEPLSGAEKLRQRDRQRWELNPESVEDTESKENLWTRVSETYRVGDLVQGTVKNIKKYGAFVELPLGIDGLLHISEMQPGLSSPRDVVSLGEQVTVRLIEPEKQRIGLSLKDLIDE